MMSEGSSAQIKCLSNSYMYFSHSQYVQITNMKFYGCGGNRVHNVSELVVRGSKFKGGGMSKTALHISETTSVKIVNSSFISNTRGTLVNFFYPRKWSGGAIITSHSNVEISQSSFVSNEAEIGGAVYADKASILHIFNSTFTNNNATDYGGSVFADNSSVTVENSDFENNVAEDGGVIYSIHGNISAVAAGFHGNTAKWGAVLSIRYSNVSMEASNLTDNSANSSGILNSYRSTIHLRGTEFYNNTAKWGAALYSAGSDSIITINESVFSHNIAKKKGIVYSDQGTITIEASEFCNNSADQGGALHSYNSSITMIMSNFQRNSAGNGGVLYSKVSNITVSECEFDANMGYSGGVLYAYYDSTITFEANTFLNNYALLGGVLRSTHSNVTIQRSTFNSNLAKEGAAVYTYNSTITVEDSEFHGNAARLNGTYFSFDIITVYGPQIDIDPEYTNDGGVIYSSLSNVTIRASTFSSNAAVKKGGVLFSRTGSIVIMEASEFDDNMAVVGGVVFSYQSTIKMVKSGFHNNTSISRGALASYQSTITMDNTTFTYNNSSMGAILYARRSKITQLRSLLVAHNLAEKYAVIFLADSDFTDNPFSNSTFSNNLGSIMAFNSSIHLLGQVRLMNNRQPVSTTSDFQEGGAVTLLHSNLFIKGSCCIEHNLAENGGAILSTTSKLHVNGYLTIEHNKATSNGGGLYLISSELNCHQQSRLLVSGNMASHKGGGMHALSSDVNVISSHDTTYHMQGYDIIKTMEYTGARLNFSENVANMGGGLYLEANAKLYILKYNYVDITTDTDAAIFTANSAAEYGGAVYVDDYTNSGTCAVSPKIECFFQVLAVHGMQHSYLKTESIHFSQNTAGILGGTLYGGLLDRCGLSPLAEVLYKNWTYWEELGDGVTYLSDISTMTNASISSHPLQVCFCSSRTGGFSCTNQKKIMIKKGQTFNLSVVAVDQIGHPVSATIQTSLNFTESGLAEGQLTKKIAGECTDLMFNVVSPHNSETLTLYASDGPCKDAELSTAIVEIEFLPCSCPTGLQLSGNYETNCSCECHHDVSQYVEQCDSDTGSFVKLSQSRAWISYVNEANSTGYLLYSNCPFDYCASLSQSIDLNQPNGADSQCAFNRSSLLCGSCQTDLSLSLASSRCLSCPSYWPALLFAITIVALLAGLGLVAMLLALNMTVAVGTLNGLIFYANIVYANKSILLPFKETNFVTVFVSWLNLELGIDMCFFPGMDTYAKTWLQLAFPAYVILLVVLVITISSYSIRFSNLIGKKDPVATLATLILLSYAKLLEVCFKSLSVGILEYPDGSRERLWLPDANVKYFSGKHIPLFTVAVLIVMVGLVYTILLFTWQWLLYLPKWRIFGWTRNIKLKTFIETYHTPCTPKHRYWTGLLLLVRVVLYLVAAVNFSHNPHIALTANIASMCGIVFLGRFVGIRVYRKWPVDILDTFIYLNILFFALLTWYFLSDPNSTNQKIVAYISVVVMAIVLLFIILYHIYAYTQISLKVKTTKLGRFLTKTAAPHPKRNEERQSPPPDDDIHRFHEVLDMIDRRVDTNDYNVPLRQHAVAPTHTVVEVHKPQLVPPSSCAQQAQTNGTVTSHREVGSTLTEEQNVERSTEETDM